MKPIFRPASKPVDPRFIDLTGKQFVRWIVKEFAGYLGEAAHWWCDCECGTKRALVSGTSMKSGNTKSCGCLKLELAHIIPRTHGEFSPNGKATPEYYSYASAKTRCNNPNNHAYKDYGGRGIEFRFTSFEEFLAEVGRKPTRKHSLDRYPNNETGHYEKGNVRWATQKEQNRNQRKNSILTIDGISRCMSEWAEVVGCPPSRIQLRIRRDKWCVPCAVYQPSGGTCNHREQGARRRGIEERRVRQEMEAPVRRAGIMRRR